MVRFCTQPSAFAARNFRLFLSLWVLLLLSGSTVATALRSPMRFTAPNKPLVCLNELQPFGFGLSSHRLGSTTYDIDPFRNGGDDPQVMPDERLQNIRSVGFDCVRMAIDIAALMAASDDAMLDRLVEQLMAGISRRVTVGLKVIADIHPLPSGAHPVSGFADVDIIDGPMGPKFRRLLQVVSRLAARNRRQDFYPAEVALELFNEPPAPSSVRNESILEYTDRNLFGAKFVAFCLTIH